MVMNIVRTIDDYTKSRLMRNNVKYALHFKVVGAIYQPHLFKCFRRLEEAYTENRFRGADFKRGSMVNA